jgi:hypothetical protein
LTPPKAAGDLPVVERWTEQTRFRVDTPPYRRLRGFALDPALAMRLDTAAFSRIVFHVPWERLDPGPIGEYLEVVDADPASGCFYEPVDLDDPRLLAQDGLAPSEGTPQFHQQMVYAVASLTIRHFERALGRRVLWRPRPDPKQRKLDRDYVRRLRIYPHALREPNAYYSPDKVALLFGYFNEIAEAEDGARPGPMVFTCLSHDIVAHETTHALLDGMHREFLQPTNPDVHAFHEAFADVVALFQHFTFPEIVREQIRGTRGAIRSQQNFLGELATQFGHATGMRSALRSAIGAVDEKTGVWLPHEPRPDEYATTMEPHARGAILVAAIFDAFLSIYERRIADLIRLATDGSGVLQPGAIHPDLVARLADEASKSANHVLTMCIRALDYTPPVDITFGEYLRAILTADADVVGDDDLHYRVAFLEAFRRRGIQPLDVRTLSVESLLWRSPDRDELRPSKTLEAGLIQLRPFAERCLYVESQLAEPWTREEVFTLQRETRLRLHAWLKKHFTTAEGRRDAAFLGLVPGRSFEVHSTRFALRATPDGDVLPQIVITLLQEWQRPVDPGNESGETMPFQGGCAIVADLRDLKVRYAIRKNAGSTGRLRRQQTFALERMASLRSTYFGAKPLAFEKEPFALLHRGV